MRVERPRPAQAAEAPDVAKQLLLAEDTLRLAGQREEELVLLRREQDRRTRYAHAAREPVDLELSDSQPVASARRGGAAENGPHPGDELLVDEGPDDVVVATACEAA